MNSNKTKFLVIISVMLALHLICGETLFADHVSTSSQSINSESNPNPGLFELISSSPVLATNQPFHIGKTGFADKLENIHSSHSQHIYSIAVNKTPLSVRNINRKNKGLWLIYRVILS